MILLPPFFPEVHNSFVSSKTFYARHSPAYDYLSDLSLAHSEDEARARALSHTPSVAPSADGRDSSGRIRYLPPWQC